MSLLFSPQKRQSGTLMSPTKGVGGNEPTSIKVVVVGDSSSGKSSFVHLLSTQQCLKHSSWTVGCNVEVMIHENNGRQFIVELFDVGGSARFKRARSVFYDDLHGLILVHDLSNKKSYANLKKWLRQVMRHLGATNDYVWSEDLQFNNGSQTTLPVLVVGTKADLLTEDRQMGSSSEEIGLDELNISCFDPETFRKGAYGFQKMSSFFNRCIHVMETKVNGNGGPASDAMQSYRGSLKNLDITEKRSPHVRRPSGGNIASILDARIDDDDHGYVDDRTRDIGTALRQEPGYGATNLSHVPLYQPNSSPPRAKRNLISSFNSNAASVFDKNK